MTYIRPHHCSLFSAIFQRSVSQMVLMAFIAHWLMPIDCDRWRWCNPRGILRTCGVGARGRNPSWRQVKICRMDAHYHYRTEFLLVALPVSTETLPFSSVFFVTVRARGTGTIGLLAGQIRRSRMMVCLRRESRAKCWQRVESCLTKYTLRYSEGRFVPPISFLWKWDKNIFLYTSIGDSMSETMAPWSDTIRNRLWKCMAKNKSCAGVDPMMNHRLQWKTITNTILLVILGIDT